MYKQSTIISTIIIILGIAIVLNANWNAKVFAQPTTTPLNFTKIIKDKFTLPAELPIAKLPPSLQVVRVISESPHTVVLYGDLIISGLNENIYLWQAIDLLKSHGFKLTQILHDGEGTQANPGRVYLIMEHP
jgi:hypothetical protein